MTSQARLQDWWERGVNWPFLGWVAVIVGPVVVLDLMGVEQRLLSMILGFLASGGLTYRVVTTWMRTSVLVHAVTGLLITYLILGAIGQAQILAEGIVVKTYVGWPLILLRCGCILVTIKWPRWLDRHFSPLLSGPPKQL